MPELKCTVKTCAHNQQMNCDLDQIKVEGDAAKNPSGTLCASFEQSKGDRGYSNSVGSMSACSCVDCKAIGCTYNEACKCQAGTISVEGSNAGTAGQTECASFKCS
ncbi:MAG: DUF1540 domain-containing protein [Lachnospiraceae bacterium]